MQSKSHLDGPAFITETEWTKGQVEKQIQVIQFQNMQIIYAGSKNIMGNVIQWTIGEYQEIFFLKQLTLGLSHVAEADLLYYLANIFALKMRCLRIVMIDKQTLNSSRFTIPIPGSNQKLSDLIQKKLAFSSQFILKVDLNSETLFKTEIWDSIAEIHRILTEQFQLIYRKIDEKGTDNHIDADVEELVCKIKNLYKFIS